MNLFGISGIIIGITSLLLSIIVLGHNYKNSLSRLWAFLSFLIAIWGFGVFQISRTVSPEWSLFWWRITHIGVILIPVISIHFILAFLKIKKTLVLRLVYATGIFFLLSNTTPYFISNIRYVFDSFYYDSPPSVLYVIFTTFFFFTFIYNNYLLYKQYHQVESLKKKQIFYFFIAIFLGFVGGSTNFLPVFGIDVYPILNFAVLIYPIVLLYGVFNGQLLNIKIIATELFTSLILLTLFGEIFFSKSFTEFVIKGAIFLFTTFFGYMIIRSVYMEVRAREKIEGLVKELEIANKQQENLIHFINHQVKGFFTKSKYIYSVILEGDYGTLNERMESIIREGLKSDNEGIAMVEDILNASNIKSGVMKYNKADMDFRDLVLSVISDQEKIARDKNLSVDKNIDEGDYQISGDSFQLKQVVKNLLDNAIKYTSAGKVIVSLSKNAGKILFSVKDTGIGITKGDKDKLFTEGGKGKNSQKINVDSTGFGLFIAKSIVEAHNGKIWAESEGEGKGSEFWVELWTRE